MPKVFVPPQMRDLTGGAAELEVEGATVRQLIFSADAACPGLADRLVKDGRLAPGLAVSIDGEIAAAGLLAKVAPESEVHFLPAVGGG